MRTHRDRERCPGRVSPSSPDRHLFPEVLPNVHDPLVSRRVRHRRRPAPPCRSRGTSGWPTRPTSRRYERILATDAYDAWLIYWPPGTGVAVHDHGASVGAFTVVSGALDEDVVIRGTTVSKTICSGESLFLPAGHVHAVHNAGEVPATSVHVYSPPLRTMGFYRADDEGRLVLERIEEATE